MTLKPFFQAKTQATLFSIELPPWCTASAPSSMLPFQDILAVSRYSFPAYVVCQCEAQLPLKAFSELTKKQYWVGRPLVPKVS